MRGRSHDEPERVTAEIVAELVARRYQALSARSLDIARHCVLDWLGVTVAARDEPLVRILIADHAEQGGAVTASVIGGVRGSIYDAALINGAAGHALDYDDVAFAMSAHPSAAILPGLVALAEFRQASGSAVLTAFVAGYEAGCRMGTLIAPAHYEGGFHGTATIGTLAAAAACSHLLGLDAERTAHAIGIAATQAAGIRCMFGTMCKPLHAGKAAQNGLRAAMLAEKGFQSRPDALECANGFAATHSVDFRPEQALSTPSGGYFLYGNLFKYHASCYMTHSVIENVAKLHGMPGFDVRALVSLTIAINPEIDSVCNIVAPRTGLEAKFSLRHCAALVLAGIDTSRLQPFSDRTVHDPHVLELRKKIQVDFEPGRPQTSSTVLALLASGAELRVSHDSNAPERDLHKQMARLQRKFRGLAEPSIGPKATGEVLDLVDNLDEQASMLPLVRCCFGSGDPAGADSSRTT